MFFFHRNINAEGGYHAKRNDNTKNDLSIRFRPRFERSLYICIYVYVFFHWVLKLHVLRGLEEICMHIQ